MLRSRQILQDQPVWKIDGLSRQSMGGQQSQSLAYAQNQRRVCCSLEERPGPKGRRSSRVLGATPDESFVQSGQRPNGLPHQLRGEMNKLFQCEPVFLEKIVTEFNGLQTSKEKKGKLAHARSFHCGG